MNTVMVIVAHPDDELLGMGGTILKHVRDGDDVHIVFLTGGELSSGYNRKVEANKVCEIIGVKSSIYLDFPDQNLNTIHHTIINNMIKEIVDKVRPKIVYTHSGEDLNMDHRIVHDSVMVACRPINTPIKELYTFNVSWWDFGEYGNFTPNFFVDIHDYVETKSMLLTIYETECKTYIHPRSEDGMNVVSRNIGFKFGLKDVEEFKQVYRII